MTGIPYTAALLHKRHVKADRTAYDVYGILANYQTGFGNTSWRTAGTHAWLHICLSRFLRLVLFGAFCCS